MPVLEKETFTADDLIDVLKQAKNAEVRINGCDTFGVENFKNMTRDKVLIFNIFNTLEHPPTQKEWESKEFDRLLSIRINKQIKNVHYQYDANVSNGKGIAAVEHMIQEQEKRYIVAREALKYARDFLAKKEPKLELENIV